MLFIEGEKKPVLTGARLAFVRKRYSDEIVFLSVIIIIIILLIISSFFPVLYIKGKTVAFVR